MDDAAMKHMASNFAKLDKFEGMDFRRWQKKMHFLLSNMSVMYMLTILFLMMVMMLPWIKSGKGPNGIIMTIKELWDSLEAKYMAKDASSKKFLVSCIIEKLPPSWKDFKHTLKHLKDGVTLLSWEVSALVESL
ncbi:hypothetical protein Tco_0123458 [Tanacetum coccineum]